MVTRWPAPLAAYGVTADKSHAAESAGRVNGSLIRDRLLTALDLWLIWDPSAEVRTGVRAVLQAADPDPYRDAFRDALVAKNGDAVNALSARKEALDQPSRFSVILGQLDDVPLDRRRAVLGSALRARPGDLALIMQMGLTYQDQHPEAAGEGVRWYQAAVAAHPDNALARNNLGVALSIQGKVEEAATCYREAIRIDPTLALGHSNLGDCHANLGDPEAAIACYEEAIRQDPRDAAIHHRLGMVLQGMGNLDRAIEAYQKAVQLDRDHIDAHMSLGAILCDVKRDYDGAIVAFEEAIRIDPGSALARLNLGNALHGKGNTPEAIAMFRKAIEIAPDYAAAHVNLGAVLAGEENQEQRIAAYREAVRIRPDHAIARANLGAALSDQGDEEGAIAELRIAHELDPKNPITRRNLGNMLQRTGDLEGVIELHRQAIEIDPKDAGAHNNLAWLRATGPERIRDGKRAIEHATRACELTGWKEPGYIDTLAAAHAEAGDFAKALEHQREALDFPAFVEADGEGGRRRLELYAGQKAFRDPAFIPREGDPP
jgi:tetratricopeptide (TPR) repeat protein